MGWERILKAAILRPSDKRLVKYVLRDGEFKTIDRIMDEIYDLLQENKKMSKNELMAMRERPKATKFDNGRPQIKGFMEKSPEYESRDTGNKGRNRRPIKEYRYIGE